MTRKRKTYSRQFKFKVALEAVKGQATINEIANQYQVHNWKKQLTSDGPAVFERKAGQHHQELATQEAELYEQIGRLKMELEWLKKSYRSQFRLNERCSNLTNPK